MKDVKKVDFVFENCESFGFNANNFSTFSIEDISTSINRIACNSIAKMHVAKSIAIEIFKDFIEEEYCPFGIVSEKIIKKDRINNHSDITSLIITYCDDSEETIFVKWDGDDYHNDNQKTHIGKNGNLFIVIDENKGINDFFDEEDLDDENYAEFKKSMITPDYEGGENDE